jgi:hypothetical protein
MCCEYEDEFVAHWKQYLVGRVPPFDNVGRAKRINDFLIRDLRGYRYNVPQNKELAKPEDANKNIWNPTTINNKG